MNILSGCRLSVDLKCFIINIFRPLIYAWGNHPYSPFWAAILNALHKGEKRPASNLCRSKYYLLLFSLRSMRGWRADPQLTEEKGYFKSLFFLFKSSSVFSPSLFLLAGWSRNIFPFSQRGSLSMKERGLLYGPYRERQVSRNTFQNVLNWQGGDILDCI